MKQPAKGLLVLQSKLQQHAVAYDAAGHSSVQSTCKEIGQVSGNALCVPTLCSACSQGGALLL
jgi:hypothetical protein